MAGTFFARYSLCGPRYYCHRCEWYREPRDLTGTKYVSVLPLSSRSGALLGDEWGPPGANGMVDQSSASNMQSHQLIVGQVLSSHIEYTTLTGNACGRAKCSARGVVVGTVARVVIRGPAWLPRLPSSSKGESLAPELFAHGWCEVSG